jgi:large subunit ribosomal protein L25
MASQFTLEAITASTKGEVKRLRETGSIPVSIQHKGMATQHFQLETAPLNEFILRHGDAAMVDLLLPPAGERQRAIVHDVNRNPLSGRLMQVTFQQIRLDDTLYTHVPIVFAGDPAASHHGEAMLQHRLDRIDIECDQNNLPANIVVDVSNLALGDVVRVADLPKSPHYKIVTPADTVLASLTSTRQAISNEERATEETTGEALS